MADDEQRHRLVVLGAGRVGKSSIINRFLNGKFVESYKPTVEDLHCRTFHVDGSVIQVDILDTAGNLEFPAMRRLSISTAHAFLLVFAVDDRQSFQEVRQLWEQIGEQRPNRRQLPCVIAANKCDLLTSRLLAMEETEDWATANGIQSQVVEVSAKNNENVRTIFRKLFDQSRPPTSIRADLDEDGGPASPANGDAGPLKRHFSANAARMAAKRAVGGSNGTGSSGAGEKSEALSRSRSLIRRVRKPKVKEGADPSNNDCVVS